MEITRDNTEIISVDLTNNKIFIRYASVTNGVISNNNVDFLLKQRQIHSDFREAIEALDIHLHGVMMFYNSAIERVSVSGFEIQSKDNKDAVKISGKLCLLSKNLVNIKTDFVRFKPDEQLNDYDGADEIDIDTNLAREEAYKYLFEDKQAQLKMDFEKNDSEETEEVQIEEENQTETF